MNNSLFDLSLNKVRVMFLNSTHGFSYKGNIMVQNRGEG